MKNVRFILFVIIIILAHDGLFAQSETYRVTLAPFSSLTNNEFSPVYYKNGIVFCSDLRNNSWITYKNGQKGLFNIFYVAKKDSGKWTEAKLLAKELTTNYNDGPVTFSTSGDTIYYCRNKDISDRKDHHADMLNKLGIYSAEFVNGKWTNIQPFPYNNSSYSIVTPALSPDGKRLFFASNMPGGYGGVDLYYCDRKGKRWDKPVNLGPTINTPKNESYPFMSKSGKLFFSSDGLKGFGGKDIYYTQEINGKWIAPIHLDSAINSPYDDFGLVTSTDLDNGFFSSNRRETDDIYSFTTVPVQFPVCDSMAKNDYCYLFYDEFQTKNDSVPVKYEWDFGNGIKKYGVRVKYCFPGPGKYEVKLNLLDYHKHDSVVSRTNYKFEIKKANTLIIHSPIVGIVNESLLFNGEENKLPGMKISDYLWNFGNGFTTRGPVARKTYDKAGEYTVRLGVMGQEDSLGNSSKVCVYKKIRIFEDYQDLAVKTAKEIGELGRSYGLSVQHDSCPTTYTNPDVKTLKGLSLLKIKIYLLNNLSEIQKQRIVESLYETRTCTIRMNDAGIDSASYPILTKFNRVLKETPDIRLQIAIHTHDQKLSGSDLTLSEKWANDFYAYFLNNGISPERVHCKGYGKSRPAAMDNNKKENKDQNTRIEFIFMNSQD